MPDCQNEHMQKLNMVFRKRVTGEQRALAIFLCHERRYTLIYIYIYIELYIYILILNIIALYHEYTSVYGTLYHNIIIKYNIFIFYIISYGKVCCKH